jgi:hypothetical protein
MHVAAKSWGTSAVVYSLIEAFRDVLDPQANFCPFGLSKKSRGAALAKAYAERLKQ